MIICSICLEPCKNPGILNLTCECKYTAHKICFNEWYKNKKNCIICHKKCGPVIFDNVLHKKELFENIQRFKKPNVFWKQCIEFTRYILWFCWFFLFWVMIYKIVLGVLDNFR